MTFEELLAKLPTAPGVFAIEDPATQIVSWIKWRDARGVHTISTAGIFAAWLNDLQRVVGIERALHLKLQLPGVDSCDTYSPEDEFVQWVLHQTRADDYHYAVREVRAWLDKVRAAANEHVAWLESEPPVPPRGCPRCGGPVSRGFSTCGCPVKPAEPRPPQGPQRSEHFYRLVWDAFDLYDDDFLVGGARVQGPLRDGPTQRWVISPGGAVLIGDVNEALAEVERAVRGTDCPDENGLLSDGTAWVPPQGARVRVVAVHDSQSPSYYSVGDKLRVHASYIGGASRKWAFVAQKGEIGSYCRVIPIRDERELRERERWT